MSIKEFAISRYLEHGVMLQLNLNVEYNGCKSPLRGLLHLDTLYCIKNEILFNDLFHCFPTYKCNKSEVYSG